MEKARMKSITGLEMASIPSLGIDGKSSYQIHHKAIAEGFDLSILLNLHLIDLVQILIICPSHKKILLQTYRNNGKYIPFIPMKARN